MRFLLLHALRPTVFSSLILLTAVAPARARGMALERANVSSSGAQANGGALYGLEPPSLSADGRFLAFAYDGDNLVPNDTNRRRDVFVRDRLAGTTERVSLSSAGAQANGDSSHPSISADGRFVAFESDANNLVPGDLNQTRDVFVRDRWAGTTERVSLFANDTESSIHSRSPSISADGRLVAFSLDFGINITPSDQRLYVRDRVDRTTVLIDFGYSLALSADGRFLAFVFRLPQGERGEQDDVYLWDRPTQTKTHIASSSPEQLSISADGRSVALRRGLAVFVQDRVSGVLDPISVTPTGRPGNDPLGYFIGSGPAINADGRFVAFESDSTDLVAGDTNTVRDIFLRDRVAATSRRISVAFDGSEANADSSLPAISANGRTVAFWSTASNLFPGDTNRAADLFVVDLPRPPFPARLAVLRPTTHEWFVRNLDGTLTQTQFGAPGDLPVPANYLDDGLTAQIAVYRPTTREWFVRSDAGATLGTTRFGGPGDLPVPADYLGIGRAQMAVFRPATCEWFLRTDAGSTLGPYQFGAPRDVPVPAPYLGDGRHVQIAVFRPGTREWFIRGDNGATSGPIQWGGPGDIPLPADYFGIGRAQIAVYRPSTAEWFLRSDLGTTTRIPFGQPGDLPQPADYRGIGRTQMAVYRPSTGEWFLREDSGAATRIPWGAPGDQPVPAPY